MVTYTILVIPSYSYSKMAPKPYSSYIRQPAVQVRPLRSLHPGLGTVHQAFRS